jgi:hypothetical protein
MTGKDHNKLLGIFHLVQGGLQTFGGLFIALIYGIIGFGISSSARRPEEQVMGTMFIILAVIVAPIILIFAGINLTAGYKLVKEKAGARNWGIAASILSLLSFPLGTALGVYGLWFMFGEEGKKHYFGNNNYAPQSFPPPPPNSWQQ